MRSLLCVDMSLDFVHVIEAQVDFSAAEVCESDIDRKKEQNDIVEQRLAQFEANEHDEQEKDKTVELVECDICEAETVTERRTIPVDVLYVEGNQNIERVLKAVSIFLQAIEVVNEHRSSDMNLPTLHTLENVQF